MHLYKATFLWVFLRKVAIGALYLHSMQTTSYSLNPVPVQLYLVHFNFTRDRVFDEAEGFGRKFQ